jgi:hypothetical protein
MAVDNSEDLSQCQYRNLYYSAIFLIKIFGIFCSSRPRYMISISEYSICLGIGIFWSSWFRKDISILALTYLGLGILSWLGKFHIWASATSSRLGLGMLFQSRPWHLFPFVLLLSANSFPHVHSVPTTQLSMNKPV